MMNDDIKLVLAQKHAERKSKKERNNSNSKTILRKTYNIFLKYRYADSIQVFNRRSILKIKFYTDLDNWQSKSFHVSSG